MGRKEYATINIEPSALPIAKEKAEKLGMTLKDYATKLIETCELGVAAQ